jgi:hypothetical protein
MCFYMIVLQYCLVQNSKVSFPHVIVKFAGGKMLPDMLPVSVIDKAELQLHACVERDCRGQGE